MSELASPSSENLETVGLVEFRALFVEIHNTKTKAPLTRREWFPYLWEEMRGHKEVTKAAVLRVIDVELPAYEGYEPGVGEVFRTVVESVFGVLEGKRKQVEDRERSARNVVPRKKIPEDEKEAVKALEGEIKSRWQEVREQVEPIIEEQGSISLEALSDIFKHDLLKKLGDLIKLQGRHCKKSFILEELIPEIKVKIPNHGGARNSGKSFKRNVLAVYRRKNPVPSISIFTPGIKH